MQKPRYLKLRMLLPALLFIVSQSATAQITFQKEYYKGDDPQYTMAVTQDKYSNAYYFAGLSDEGSVGHNHLGVVAKTNFKGVLQWSRVTSADHYPAGWTDMKATYGDNNTHTGVVVAGHSYYPDFNGSGSGFRLARINSSGTTTQYKSYTPSTSAGCSYKVEQALNNGKVDGFIAAGFEQTRVQSAYVVRTDESLSVTWAKTFTNSNGYSRAFSVKQTADKGFIVTGDAYPHNIFVIKLDASGAITWQKMYPLQGTFGIGDDIIEVMKGSKPEYYVLAHTAGPTSEIVLLRLNDTGGVISSKYYAYPGTQVARGMVYLPSGHITFTATTTGSGLLSINPILIKTDAALSTQVFGKRYTTVQWVSCPVLTTDKGYIIGSSPADLMSSGSGPHYLIKTDSNGVSDCNETNITLNISTAAVSVINGTFTAAPGYPAVDLSSIDPVTLTEEVVCKDFCKGATYTTSHTYPHACDGQSIQLTAPCLNAAAIKWFKLPNLATVIGTGVSYTPSTPAGNADYVSRCYDEDGCITYEVIHHFTVTPPPFSIGQSMAPACYGQYITLNSGCGPGCTSHWINPAGVISPSVTIEALSNQTYSVNCIDQWGCLVQTNTFDVEVNTYPVVQVDPPVTICEGSSYDLNGSFVSLTNCNWYTLPGYMPVIGSVVSPTTTTSYYAECRDAQGCITYHVVEVTVTPAPVSGIATLLCEGNTLVLNSYPGSGCIWTWADVNTNLLVSGTGFIPTPGSHHYRGTCVDWNGCISYFDVYADVTPWTVIAQTVYAYCGQPFDFDAYSNLCEYGISAWASLMGGQYVLFPSGWAPTANTTIYGFGNNVLGNCCRVELQVIVIPAQPTFHELCFKGQPYIIPFTCAPGATMQWTKNNQPQPNGLVNGPGLYEVTCTDNASGCITQHAIFSVIFDPKCELDTRCYEEGTTILTGGCPDASVTVEYEKDGTPYPGFIPPSNPASVFYAPTNGPGTYTLTCRDAKNNLLAKKYYHLYSCEGATPAAKNSNTGIEDIAGQTLINVYPNPGNGIFNLKVQAQKATGYVVKVSDMLGKVLISDHGNSATDLVLDLTGRAPGVYHVQVMIDGSVYSRKIVLQ